MKSRVVREVFGCRSVSQERSLNIEKEGTFANVEVKLK